MAEKKAKTAEKGGDASRRHLCPSCGADSKVVMYTGYGRKGFFWVCDKNCGYSARTR
jgi:ssDNA-binding Zn-finger/Zn-ribbon topoisomerase 1